VKSGFAAQLPASIALDITKMRLVVAIFAIYAVLTTAVALPQPNSCTPTPPVVVTLNSRMLFFQWVVSKKLSSKGAKVLVFLQRTSGQYIV
jgi:hypothetical protein